MLEEDHEIFGILTQILAWPRLMMCLQIVYCNTCLIVGSQILDSDDELISFVWNAL